MPVPRLKLPRSSRFFPRSLFHLTALFGLAPPRSFDIKWMQVCADEVTKFKDMGLGSKPLFILFKSGLEKARMDKGANGNELQRIVEANKGDK